MLHFLTHPQGYFFIVFTVLSIAIMMLDSMFGILRDTSVVSFKPLSLPGVQLAWWSVIISSSFIAILVHTGRVPKFYWSTFILLGISIASRWAVTAISAKEAGKSFLPTRPVRSNFFIDIISDDISLNIQCFQSFALNAGFGIYFTWHVLNNLARYPTVYNGYANEAVNAGYNYVMPDIQAGGLIILALSNAMYAAFKIKATKN